MSNPQPSPSAGGCDAGSLFAETAQSISARFMQISGVTPNAARAYAQQIMSACLGDPDLIQSGDQAVASAAQFIAGEAAKVIDPASNAASIAAVINKYLGR